MLRAIPQVEVGIWGPSSDQVGVLWLVSGFVDLAGVSDALDNGEGDGFLCGTVSAQFSFRRVVVRRKHGTWSRQIHVCDLQVVHGRAGSVGAEQHAMATIGLVGLVLHIRKPLSCQGGPVEGTAVHEVVEEDGVLLPDLVLLVDELVLHDFLVVLLGRVACHLCIVVSRCCSRGCWSDIASMRM